MRVYIAGPMTLHRDTDWNFRAFDAAAKRLRERGHTPVCPSEVDRAVWGFEGSRDREMREGMTRARILGLDLQLAATCGAIYMLKDWELASGAIAELALMRALDRQVLYEPGAMRGEVGVLPGPREEAADGEA